MCLLRPLRGNSVGDLRVKFRVVRSTSNPMAEYCDVAVPVPLDQLFTYRIGDGVRTDTGGRVLVPFRQQRLVGVVTEIHDRCPPVSAKNVYEALDPETTPALSQDLLRLGKWISEYYLAPI